MKEKQYIWQVSWSSAEPVEVIAADKLGAIMKAAKRWGMPWTKIARDCDCLRLRKGVRA